MRLYAGMVYRREPLVKNVVGFVDGLSIAIMEDEDEDEDSQATSYNGFYGDTRCNNVFAPTGKIFYAIINNPGSWHDTQVAFPLVMVVLAKIGRYDYALIRDLYAQ